MHAWTSISIRIIYPSFCSLLMLEADILLALIMVLCVITSYLSLHASAATPIFNGTFGGYTRDTNQAEQNTAKTTLTRYGIDINFDPETCPSDSLRAMSKLEHATPLHNDCPTLFIVGGRKGGTTP